MASTKTKTTKTRATSSRKPTAPKTAPRRTTATKTSPETVSKTASASHSARTSSSRLASSRSKASRPVADRPIVRSETPSVESKPFRNLQVNRASVITGIIVIVVIALLYIFRSLFVVATVNGQPISRMQLYSELEKQNGKQALDGIITKTLIMQEAEKEHVTVSQSEIDSQIKQIEQNLAKQGQKLDQVLQTQGMTRQSLEEQIKLQKLAEKMVGKNVAVSDKEIDDYIAQHKDSLPTDTDQNQLRAQVKSQLQSQKENDKFQAWLENLQKSAKINYLVNYQ